MKTEKQLVDHLANVYERYKDNTSEIAKSDLAFLEYTVRSVYADITNSIELSTDARAKQVYNMDLNDFNQTFDHYRRTGIIVISQDNNNSVIMPGYVNLYFRAWHDSVHFAYNYPFDFVGESLTWMKQSEGLSNEIKAILFSEIVMQAAHFISFGYFMEKQKVVIPSNVNALMQEVEEYIHSLNVSQSNQYISHE